MLGADGKLLRNGNRLVLASGPCCCDGDGGDTGGTGGTCNVSGDLSDFSGYEQAGSVDVSVPVSQLISIPPFANFLCPREGLRSLRTVEIQLDAVIGESPNSLINGISLTERDETTESANPFTRSSIALSRESSLIFSPASNELAAANTPTGDTVIIVQTPIDDDFIPGTPVGDVAVSLSLSYSVLSEVINYDPVTGSYDVRVSRLGGVIGMQPEQNFEQGGDPPEVTLLEDLSGPFDSSQPGYVLDLDILPDINATGTLSWSVEIEVEQGYEAGAVFTFS